ncbi:tetratricopeptide repeat protein 27-like isoform X3 [Rosa chinensis]|uniref:tetratricopeptide repeat protein 27-like isoform X3 n=1 Tax=Rosa chinensis TaxID=74649 RepID=UPI001AD8DFE6|nr:tetratricopeptide repeat protein 27-like isoform X3 [Rosa chinensis]
MMEHIYARVDSCRLHFESAEAALVLSFQLQGFLASVLYIRNDISKHPSESHEASDILLTSRLVENESDSGVISDGIQVGGTAADPLSAIHQAVILAKCLLIEKSTRHDDMQRWEMAPHIEAIDSQLSSYFIVQGIKEPSPGVADRIPFCCGVYIPTVSALRKEYGELCVRCGLIGEAIKIFEDLELWDNLIFCYRLSHVRYHIKNSLLEKKAAAVELIKTWLSETPNDPRLWCSLGDVTNDDACFKKALEVSNDKSARAKDGDIEKSLDGFTRAVQLDPENGEAWNNIACLHMIKGKSKEAFMAFREALKFKRNSYQLWENYSHVALDVGNVAQALEATRKVLDLTNNKRIDAELLERIMTEVESMASPTNSAMTDDGDNFPVSGTTNAESDVGKSREAEHLVEFLGKVLQQVLEASCC